jgi:hypothetical protein
MMVSNSIHLLAFARPGEWRRLEQIVQHILVPEAVWYGVTHDLERPGADERAARAVVAARGLQIIGTSGLFMLSVNVLLVAYARILSLCGENSRLAQSPYTPLQSMRQCPWGGFCHIQLKP